MFKNLFLPIACSLCLLAANGCGGDGPVGPGGPISIPFNLTIPPNRPSGQYYAISGVNTVTQLVRVGDSLIESQVPSIYAQFNHDAGVPHPALVSLNAFELDRNLDSDTLRLDMGGSSLYGDNLWAFRDSTGTDRRFTMPVIDAIDSVGPFKERKTFRSDTTLEIGWKIPRLGSSGLFLIWRAPNRLMTVPLNDFTGQVTLEAGTMQTLIGAGKVTLLRYTNATNTLNGRVLVLTRVAEHTYDVTVQ